MTNCYPFGNTFADASTGQSLQPYKYNGKELDRMYRLDRYNYGARNYDAAICQWTSVDSLAEKYYNVSPYVYCGNNPINAIDPDGKKILGLLINSRNQIVFTRKVTNDVRRIAKALMLTPEGTKMLKGAIRSKIQLKMEISPDINITHYKTGKLDYIYGEQYKGTLIVEIIMLDMEKKMVLMVLVKQQ